MGGKSVKSGKSGSRWSGIVKKMRKLERKVASLEKEGRIETKHSKSITKSSNNETQI